MNTPSTSLANAAASFQTVMEYLDGVCVHSPTGSGRDCYVCDAYASAQRGQIAAADGAATTSSWFTVAVGFLAETDPDTVQLALGKLETLNVQLTLRGQLPLDACIVSVARILEYETTDPDWERKQGFAYRLLADGDPTGPELFAPYADIIAVEVY